MTTIAFDGKFVCCDGKIVNKDIIETLNCKKWVLRDGDIYFFSGFVAHIEKFLDEYLAGKSPGMEYDLIFWRASPKTGTLVEIWILNEDGKLSFCEWPVIPGNAIGSGKKFAIGAMEVGADAYRAIAAASNRDIYTGGIISKFNLATMKFVNHEIS